MDQGIKRLIQTHPADVLALALPGAEHLGMLTTDVAVEPQLMLDTLQRIRYQGVECAANIEAEARPRPDMPRRCFEYGARASIIHGLPVVSIVLWLEPGGAIPATPYELRAGDRLIATWHFIGIEVYRLRAADLLARGQVGLLPLIAFTDDGKSLETIEAVAQAVQKRAPAEDVAELELLLALFSARSLGTETVLAMIRRLFMSTEILDESPLYHYLVQKAREQAMAEGVTQGVTQGEERGLREGVLAVLRGRFGDPATDVAEAISTASRETLLAILLNATTDTLAQVRERLGLSADEQPQP
jgi:hypothetical protein